MDKRLKDDMLAMVIEELAHDSHIDDNNRLASYEKVFDAVYSENYRHEYSKITRVLFSITNPEERDYLLEKLSIIESVLQNYDTKKRLHKLSDHIELENIRMSELEKISNKAIGASQNINDIKEELENEVNTIEIKTNAIEFKTNNAQNKLDDIHKDMKNNTTQSITILSIFAGVVMAFTGGMSYISQALVALNSIGPYRAGIFITLIGTVMFDLIFLLLYMIGKLTDRYIGSATCKCQDPKKGCRNRKINCCIKRYPYIIWFNLISLIIITSILIVTFLDKYDLFVHRFIDIVTSFEWYKLFQDLGIIACVLAIYVAFGFAVHKILKIECDNSEQ
jgi:hypothetical protein